MPLTWVLDQDWITFDAALARLNEVEVEERAADLADAALAAQGKSKDINRRLKQLEAIRRRQSGGKRREAPAGDARALIERFRPRKKEVGGGGR